VTAAVLFNFLALRKIDELRWSVHLGEQTTAEVLLPIFMSVNFISLIFLSVSLLICGVWMKKKINGPIYRITEDLRQIKKGNASILISLRQKDDFGDVAVAINDMLYCIRKRFNEIKAEYDEISQALEEIKVAYANGRPSKKMEDSIILKVQMLQKKLP